MKKILCLAAVLLVAVVALAACGDESQPTSTPVPPTPTPTAAPVSTPTAVPTPVPTPTTAPTPTPSPAPTPTPTPAPTPTPTPDAPVGGGEVLSDGECPTDGSLDSAAAIGSCSSAALQNVKSVSFEGVIDLLAIFPLGEGEGGEAAMRLSGAMVVPDRIRYRIDIGPEEERVSIAGMQIGMDMYVQDPESGLWFKGATEASESLEALQLVGMFMTPVDPGASLDGTTELDDGATVYRLVSSQPPLGSEALFLSGTGVSMTVLVGVADFLVREIRISARTPDGESGDFITISYYGYNETSEIEPPSGYLTLPNLVTDVGTPESPMVVGLTRNDNGDVEVMFNEPVVVEGGVELLVLDPTSVLDPATGAKSWGLPLLGGSGTDTLTFDADAEGSPPLVLGESQILGFWFPDFESNLVDSEGASANLNFDVWTYE